MANPKVERKKISDLKQDPSNANIGTERGLRMLDDSISEAGAGRSGLADRNGILVAGNKTQERLVDRGIEDVIVVHTKGDEWVVVQRDDLDLLNDDPNNTARKLAFFDNRSSELDLQWSAEQLLADLNAGVDLSQFWNEHELQELLDGLVDDPPADAGAQVDKASALAAEYGTALGQIWQLGKHRMAIGDCTDKALVAELMQGEKADAVVTDPPYGQNQDGVTNDEPEKLTDILTGAIDALPLDNGIVVAFQSPRTFPEWLDITRRAGYVFERMLWMYKAAQMTFPWRGWLLKSEAILISSKGNGHWNEVNPYAHDCYYMSEVSNELPENSGWHGSVKPLHVVSDLVQRVSSKGDTVYEPFAGTGTTLIACEQYQRVGRGIEINPESAAIVLDRMERMGLTPTRE